MGSDLTHSDGLDRMQRVTREQSGQCPICGGKYDSAKNVINRESDGDWPMGGIAYEHGTTECIEWADGRTLQYDAKNERIIQ